MCALEKTNSTHHTREVNCSFMAQVLPESKPEPVCCKPAQELVGNGVDDQLPSKYSFGDGSGNGPTGLSVPIAPDIPVIDFSRLLSSSSAMDEELVKLRSALSSWCCFQVVNHGIENSILDEIRKLAREFFHLPKAEKQKVQRAANDNEGEGYGEDMVLSEQQQHQTLIDRLGLLVIPQDRQNLKYWPQSPQSFREVLQDYTFKVKEIQEQVLKSIARALSLPEDSFLKKFGEKPTMYARFNYYPPVLEASSFVGLKPHADASGITILLQDEQVEGLQVLKDGRWFRVPVMPHALLVNVGEQVEIMSNGICKGCVHRVYMNSKMERKTVAMFCVPDLEADVEPLEELVDEKRPRMFGKVRNYPEMFYHYYHLEKRAVDVVRI